VVASKLVRSQDCGDQMTEAVASVVALRRGTGAAEGPAAPPTTDVGCAERDPGVGGTERELGVGGTERELGVACGGRELGSGRAEEGVRRVDPEPNTPAQSGLPKLAGRIKRRPERAEPPAAPYAAVLEVDAELEQAAKGVAEKTEPLWVERAKRRTGKHLREEVELCEMVVRRTGRRGCLPPTEEQMQQYFELERAVTTGRGLVDASVAEQELRADGARTEQDANSPADQQCGSGAEAALDFQPNSDAGFYPSATLALRCQMSGARPAAATADCQPGAAGPAWCQMSGEPETTRARSWDSHLVALAALVRAHLGLAAEGKGAARAFDELAASMYDRQSPGEGRHKASGGRVILRLRVRESTARFYRLVERAAAGLLPRGMSFMEYACSSVWAAWRHTLDPKVACAQIYARDRHRCSCPVCGRRDVTPHHVKFRSRGGDDTDGNVVAICSECHLRLIHGGVITVEGRAGKLTWTIGRCRTLRVVGRQKVVG
jgi:hypothetical protein